MTTATATRQSAEPAEGTLDVEEELAFIMWLGRDILGYKELEALHVDWFRDALTCPKLLHLDPRSHFKTTVFTIVYVLYRILRNPAVRILILNEVLANATDFLREIKTHMESNDAFRAQFGALNRDAPKWTTAQIQIKSGRMTKDATVSVAGTLGAINSKHVDLIVGDDLISGKNTQTVHQRNKIKRWLFQTVFPILEPFGQIILTGTRWHVGDLYSEFLKGKRFDAWKKVVTKAEWTDEKGKHHVLFPERWSKEALAEKKKEMGTALYNAQYLNDATQLQGLGFREGWLKFYETEPAEMSVYQGTDLAISKKDSAAFFAHVTIGIPKEGDIYILNIVHDRLDFPEQCRVMKSQAVIHDPLSVGIEAVAYQEALPQWLRADPEAKKYPWVDVKSNADKILRLTSLAPLFEAGVIHVREDMHAFMDEYLSFPSGSTFDILDALYFAIGASKRNAVEPEILEVFL